MDRPFLILVGMSSLAMFGGVLFLTAPATPRPPSAAPTSAISAAAAEAAVEASVYYAGCNEVRALGKAPLYRGQPGYRIGMDGDHDGIACEPHHED